MGQPGFELGRGPGQAVQLIQGQGAALAVGQEGFHPRLQGDHGHCHVRGMHRDARLAGAENRMHAVVPLQGRTAAAGLALVAGHARVVEVRAARALQQVARGRRLVADLPRSASQQRLGQQRVVLAHTAVGSQVAVAYLGTDTQATLGAVLDHGQGQAADIDQVAGPLDAQLHQVDQIGTTGDKARPWLRGHQADRLLHIARTRIAERHHGLRPPRRRRGWRRQCWDRRRSGTGCRSCAHRSPGRSG